MFVESATDQSAAAVVLFLSASAEKRVVLVLLC
jgi:hypothetical protein